MKNIVRRVTIVAAGALIAAGSLVAPSMASAADPLPTPEVSGSTYYDYSGAAYVVSWSAAEASHTAGTTLTGYEGVLYTGAPTYTTVVSQSTTTGLGAGSFLFGDLNVGQLYQAAVRAIYSVDNGVDPVATEYSAWKNATAGKALKPAPAPTSVTATASAVGVVTVRWKAPSIPANTEGIAAYGIDASPEIDFDDIINGDYQFESTGKSVNSTKRSAVLKGLRPGLTYDVAVYSIGDGEGFSYGDSADTTVKVLGKPAKPTKLKVKTLKGSSSKLTWKGAKVTKAGPVDGYRIYVNGTFKKKVGKSVRSYTAKGQKSGKRYTYTVKAYNKVGYSSAAKVTKKRP